MKKPYYLVEIYQNDGWGTRIGNYYYLIDRFMVKNKYQAKKVLGMYPTKFRKGRAGRDVGGNKKTTYEQEEGGKIKIEIVQVVPEDT